MARVLCILLLLCNWQCNDKASDPQSPTPPDGGDQCPQLALEAFEQYIQPAIDVSCGTGGCHGDDGENPPGGGLALRARQGDRTDSDIATINRAKMRSYGNGWLIREVEPPGKGSVLLGKVSDDTHGGGNQVAAGHITAEGIEAWVKAEQKCSQQPENETEDEAQDDES